MDRRVLAGVVPGLAGLAFGAAAALGHSPAFGMLAAACGLAAGAVALIFLGRVQAVETEADHMRAEIAQLQEDVTAGHEAAEAAARFAELMTAREEEPPPPDVRGDSFTDPDTGLLDSRYFQIALDNRVAAARRHLQPVTLLLVSVEGGSMGDAFRRAAITSFGEMLRTTLRECDTACRLGDASFGLILEDTPEAGGVWAAERLRLALLRKGDNLLRLAAGVAAYPSHALDAPDLLHRAERALDQARHSGSSNVEVATAD